MATSNGEDRIQVEFGGTTEDLESASKRASKAVSDFAKAADESAGKTNRNFALIGPLFKGVADGAANELMGRGAASMGRFGEVTQGVFEEIRGNWDKLPQVFRTAAVGIGVALAAIAVAVVGAKAAASTAEYTESMLKLGRQLGTTASQASIWKSALDDVNATESDLDGAVKGITKQLRDKEDQLNKMGVATRDANGALLDQTTLVLNGIEALNGYKQGTERNLAAQAIFGRGVQANSNLLLLNADTLRENEAWMRELGSVVGEENVAAWQAYDSATDKSGIATRAFSTMVGNAFMPVMTKVVELFNDIMPTAITVVKGALGGLLSVFWTVRNGVIVVWETIKAFIFTVTEPIRSLGSALMKLATGDFKGAADEMMSWPNRIGKAWGAAMDTMTDASRETREQLWNLFATPEDIKAPKAEGKDYKEPKEKKEKKAKEDPSNMDKYELELEAKRKSFMLENDLRELSKRGEMEYWQEVLTRADTTAKDREKIAMKISRLEVDLLRQSARDQAQIEQLTLEGKKAAALDAVDAKQQALEQELQLGQINQQQYLVAEQAFIKQRLDAELAFLEAKRAIAEKDPDKNLVLLEQLEQQKAEIRRRYDAQVLQNTMRLQQETAAPLKTIMQTAEQSLTSLGTTMLTSWKKTGQALQQTFTSIGTTMVQELFLKPLAARAVAWARERVFSLAGIGTKAAEAGAGAAASQASIPIIGPGLALAAMATVFGAVAGMSGKVPSAAGGFDIPPNMDPITQLHRKEMVLPEDIATPMRENLASGSMGANNPLTFNISAVDAEGVRRLLMNNGPALADAIRRQVRNFGAIK